MCYSFDLDNFTIVKFYSYPCCVVDRIIEYEETGFHGTRGDKTAKDFFDAILNNAQKITGKHLMDNKIAFKIVSNVDNKIFYVGYKDNIYCIGNKLNPYMNSCYTYDFETCTKQLFTD